MHDKNETYYEVLRVSRGASISEIVAAYHAARGAFSKDSIAMYSLFSQDEADKVLSKLEEAYLTLSNIEKKREYDRSISNGNTAPALRRPNPQPQAPAPTPSPSAQPSLSSPLPDNVRFFEPPTSTPTPRMAHGEDATDPHLTQPEIISGTFLKTIRERRSLSIEDVSRITKIPLRFLKAIEAENQKDLPAKVYVQGFIKNLAVLYKLDPAQTARTFTSLMETKKTGT